MPNPLPSTVYVDEINTQLAIAFIQESRNFIAGRVFPSIDVTQETGKYAVYPKGYFMRNEMGPRPLNDKPRAAGYKVDFASYSCEEYGLEFLIDDRLRVNTADPMGPDRGGATYLAQQALINGDVAWASKFFKTGVWTTQAQGVSTSPNSTQFLQFDQSGSDPSKTVRKWVRNMHIATGYRPNKGVLGRDTYDTLVEHPDFKDRIKHTQTGIVSLDLMAAIFELDELYVADAVQNTAREGLADSNDFIVNPKGFWLGYAPATASTSVPSAGYTFRWTSLVPGSDENIMVVERYRDDRAKTDILQGRSAWDQRLTAADLGVFLYDCVA